MDIKDLLFLLLIIYNKKGTKGENKFYTYLYLFMNIFYW